MRKSFTAFAFAVFALAQPASAITFSQLTTIYLGSGVLDDGNSANTGTATSFTCSNVSGVTAQIRYLVLAANGQLAKSHSLSLLHGNTITVVTHATNTLFDDIILTTGFVAQGVVNIESTQSAVFCTAVVLDAADKADGYALPLVRVNPHPGTVE
jgi:hypothetical protein